MSSGGISQLINLWRLVNISVNILEVDSYLQHLFLPSTCFSSNLWFF